ncbi:hypothetical protein [Bacillus sp. V2I10]|nr:malate/lactate dehydrogenase [Bacillus sp. V2I10]
MSISVLRLLIRDIIELDLNAEEQDKFKNSAAILKEIPAQNFG